MAFIEWNDSLGVGVPTLDRQHQKLIGLLNGLHEAMRAGQGHAVLDQTIGELATYTQTHFATEESLMARHDYPEAAAHKAEHAALIDQVAEYRRKVEEGQLGVSTELIAFLKDWLQNHILGTDKRYGPHLTARGVR